MADAQPVIEIRHLVKSYRRGGQIVPVLTDITLDIQRGEFTALMGPSGSGKSTLLNLIAGIDKPDGGVLRVSGLDITRLSEGELADWRARNVGFVFQFYNLMPVLSAFENVELPLTLTHLSRKERRERVAIARAVISDPLLIVADEPTGDLDRQSASDILAMLQRLNAELGTTIVMVTHDAHAAKTARRLVHLEKGELLFEPPAG